MEVRVDSDTYPTIQMVIGSLFPLQIKGAFNDKDIFTPQVYSVSMFSIVKVDCAHKLQLARIKNCLSKVWVREQTDPETMPTVII